MKKESKNLGIRKACPSCGKAVVRNGIFPAGASFTIPCAYCKDSSGRPTQVQITIELKATAEAVTFKGLQIKGIKLIGMETTN